MQLKKQNRSQLLYKKRSQTAPSNYISSYSSSFYSSTLPARFQVKTIRSLNFYCLSKIFQYVEFKDLMNCRLVCLFWKECTDFHLARRTHFIYGKKYNDLSKSQINNIDVNESNNQSLIVSIRNSSIQINSIYSCEKCMTLNEKILDDKYESLLYPESKSSGLSFDNFSSSESSSLSASQTSISSSTSDLTISSMEREHHGNEDIDGYRCQDCQAILREMAKVNNDNNAQQKNRENYYDQYTDVMNLNIFERILSRLPKLTTLKFAEGYRYGLKQNCLDISGVNIFFRTFRHCPHLTNIDLSNCVGLNETDFYHLVKLYGSHLNSLNVSGCRIDEICLRIIVKGCDRLRYLNVANNFCRLQGGCLEWISDRIETMIADYNQNVRVLDGLLQGKGRNIIELELNVGYCFNPSMPYKILGNHFQNLISLKIIFKSFGKRKEGIFAHLSQLNELECLYLIEEIDDFDSESSLDDYSVLKILSSCGLKLRELYLHAASSLFGGSSSLTDQSIGQIDTLCPLLEVFSIKRASITDQSLNAIAKLKNAYTVQLIDLEYISENGIKQIMSSFREVENQHKEKIKRICGIDIDVGQNGPKVEKMRRN